MAGVSEAGMGGGVGQSRRVRLSQSTYACTQHPDRLPIYFPLSFLFMFLSVRTARDTCGESQQTAGVKTEAVGGSGAQLRPSGFQDGERKQRPQGSWRGAEASAQEP